MSDTQSILERAQLIRCGHHNVYVVELNETAKRLYSYMGTNPALPAVYVGLTGHTPEERFENHKNGHKAGRGYVRDYGVKLLPDLYKEYNPSPYDLTVEVEKALAEKLRQEGYIVLGGY